MGELDALEDDLAAEATTSGSVPAYLQVRGVAADCCCAYTVPCVHQRQRFVEAQAGCTVLQLHSLFTALFVPSHSATQDVDLPEVPHGQAQQAQPQAADEFGLPAIPQRT